MKINNRIIRNFSRPFIIAEIGANHNGDLELAKKMITSAKKAGASAVKFQSWTKRSIFTKRLYKNQKPDFQLNNIKTQEQLIDKLTFSNSEYKKLALFCKRKKIIFSSTPFDANSAVFLSRLKVPFFKVASMDLDNIPFLKYLAKYKKPMIVSTGFGSLKEIAEAIDEIKSVNKNAQLTLLHCVSAYPPKDKDVNLNNIKLLRKTFNLPVGFSDHTKGSTACLSAITLGAAVIEKHFTLDKNMIGWDHPISADFNDMKVIASEGNRANKFLGSKFRFENNSEKNIRIMRRSIVVKRIIKKGEKISMNNIDFKRPGAGISPSKLEEVINRKAKKTLLVDQILNKKNLI